MGKGKRYCFSCRVERDIDYFLLKPDGNYHIYCFDCCREKCEDAWRNVQLAPSNLKMSRLINKMVCKYCLAKGKMRFYRIQISNGTYQVRGWCFSCYMQGKKPLPFKLFKNRGLDLESIPIIEKLEGRKCAVLGCESYQTEWHHFAPKHLFGDFANDWPQSPLCKKHHAEWHEKVTPNMHKRK